MNPDGIEREFKLRGGTGIEPAQVDAIVREAGGEIAERSQLLHRDEYFDDPERSLARADCGLRRRQRDGAATLGFKGSAEVEDGLLLRAEVEAPWTGDMPGAAAGLPPELRAQVEPLTLDRPLLPVLQLQVDRERRLLALDGGSCELVIDRVVATADGRAASFSELELEVGKDAGAGRELVQQLAAQLSLAAAADSKLEHAHTLLGLPAIENGPAELQPLLGLGTALRSLLRQYLLVQRREETGVRLDRQTECVHRLRIANRRMRALVRAFSGLWAEDDAGWLREHLGATGRSLGELRDLDVTIAELEPMAKHLPEPLRPQLDRLRQLLLDKRRQRAAAVRGWLESADRLAAERRVEHLLIDPPSPPQADETAPAAEAVLCHLAKAARGVRKLGEALPAGLPLAAVHELRVAQKRLRYVLEAFQPVLPQRLAKAGARLAKLQQRLGDVCDHEIGSQYFLDLLPEVSGDAELAALLGSLATVHALRGRRARVRAARAWQKVDRKRFWERFQPE